MVNCKNLLNGMGLLLLAGSIVIPYQVNATLNPACITTGDIYACEAGTKQCGSEYDLNGDGLFNGADVHKINNVTTENVCYVVGSVKVSDACITDNDIKACMAGKQCGSEYDLNVDGAINDADISANIDAREDHMCYIVGPTLVDDVCIRSDDIIDCMAGKEQCGSEHDLNGDGAINDADIGTVTDAKKERMCYVLTSSVANVITLQPGLSVFSTPAIAKSIYFSNGGRNVSFATMEKGKWKAIAVDKSNVGNTVKPFYGYIVRNDNSEDVVMAVTHGRTVNYTKHLDTGWNFLGIINTDDPFKGIVGTTATMIKDLTNGGDTNKIGEFIEATRFMLGKAYAVFVNKSGKYLDARKCDINGDGYFIADSDGLAFADCELGGQRVDDSNYRCDVNGDGVLDVSDSGAFSDCTGLSGKQVNNGDDSDGDDTVKPTCSIQENPTTPTNGDVTLMIIGTSEGIQAKSWDDLNYGTILEYYQKTVSSNGIYTGYVIDENGTGSCTGEVSNIDKIKPAISIIGTSISVYETGSAFDSSTILKYKWLTSGESCREIPESGYLTGMLEGKYTSYWGVEANTGGLANGEYYLCVFENSIRDKAGNGNTATISDKITITGGGEGDDTVKPTCSISQSFVNGTVTLTLNPKTEVQAISWDGIDWSTLPNYTKDVTEDGTYRGYIVDNNGNTGSCSTIVSISTIARCDVNGDGVFNSAAISADDGAVGDCTFDGQQVNDTNFRCNINGLDEVIDSADLSAYADCKKLI